MKQTYSKLASITHALAGLLMGNHLSIFFLIVDDFAHQKHKISTAYLIWLKTSLRQVLEIAFSVCRGNAAPAVQIRPIHLLCCTIVFLLLGALTEAHADEAPSKPIISEYTFGRNAVYFKLAGPVDISITSYEVSIDDQITWHSATYHQDTNSVTVSDARTNTGWVIGLYDKEDLSVQMRIRAVNSIGPGISSDEFYGIMFLEYDVPDMDDWTVYQMGSCKLSFYDGHIDGPNSHIHRLWRWTDDNSGYQPQSHEILTSDGKTSLDFYDSFPLSTRAVGLCLGDPRPTFPIRINQPRNGRGLIVDRVWGVAFQLPEAMGGFDAGFHEFTIGGTLAGFAPFSGQPIANAGTDQTGLAYGAAVTLDGSGSNDPDVADTLLYAWEQTSGTPVALSDTSAEQPTFTAPTLGTSDSADTLVFSLVVTDSNNMPSLADTVSITIDPVPTVTSVSVPENGTYQAADTLSFTVNTSEAVTVMGTPSVALTIGSAIRRALYASGSGSSSLVFEYKVQSGDNDADGIAVGELSFNEGTLQDATGNSLILTLNSVGATTNILVDNIVPTVAIQNAPSSVTTTAAFSVTFEFSEEVIDFAV